MHRPSSSLRLHVACGQLVMQPGDIGHQLEQVNSLSAEASKAGARLILFAEGALHGYCLKPEIVAAALSPNDPAVQQLRQISRRHGLVIAVGAFEKANQKRYISHFVVWPDGRVRVQRKHSLTPAEIHAGFTPGPIARTLFDVNGIRCAIAICADTGIEGLWDHLKQKGCQLCLIPTAGGANREDMRRPEDLDDPTLRTRYLKAMEKVCFLGEALLRCRDLGIAMMATNLAGDDGIAKYHPGHSSIVDSRGCLVALHPGEYVADFLRPVMIHGEVIVRARPMPPLSAREPHRWGLSRFL